MSVIKHAILILAAGNSSRLGQPKQLLPYQQHTLLLHTVQEALALDACQTVVILGAYAEQIQPTLPPQVEVVYNENWQKGMGTSIRAGMHFLSTQSSLQGCILAVCDQPFISRTHFQHLLPSPKHTKASIVSSTYGDTVGVPAYFQAVHFPELSQLADQSGAKPLLETYRSQVVTIPFPDGSVDIDTQADYRKLLLL